MFSPAHDIWHQLIFDLTREKIDDAILAKEKKILARAADPGYSAVGYLNKRRKKREKARKKRRRERQK